MKEKKWFKRGAWIVAILFTLMNVVAFFHAYKFTHFTNDVVEKTKDPKKLSTAKKIGTLIFGVNNPRPKNDKQPSTPFETIKLKSNKEIECWSIKTEHAKGTVVLCHGFSGQKSTMLDKAAIFRELGYNTFIVDFMGSGGSEGNQTTIGFKEGEQVKTCFDYLTSQGEKNIYLFGTSMGAVAVMKCMNDYPIQPKGILIECPFGSMYQTVCARFKTMHAPTFPMAGLLVFWGGIQNGFWAFGHNPSEYAKNISCPTLLMSGGKDEKVSGEEINEIFSNLKGKKQLKIYKESGHENFLTNNEAEWRSDVEEFLGSEKKDFHKVGNKTQDAMSIFRYIDQLYEIRTAASTDSLSDFSQLKPENEFGYFDNGHGLLNYANQGVKKYYRHLSFDFYIFKNKNNAISQFDELIRLAKIDLYKDSLNIHKYRNLFSKGGSSYILYENMIIHHSRRCNYDEKKEIPREEKLVAYLLDGKRPLHNYFLRVRCGWATAEIK